MTTAVSRRIPPQRLINLMNPMVRAVLESPLHTVVDDALIVLHVQGRKSGRYFDIPVGYITLDANLIVLTQHTWRANFRGGVDIDVTHRGRRQPMRADLDEDPAAVAAALYEIIGRFGPKAAERRLGLRLRGRIPSLSELEEVVRDYHLSKLTLRPGTSIG